MKKIAAFGFALLMIFAVFVPGVAALNDPKKEGYQSVVNPNPTCTEGCPTTNGFLYVQLACRAPQIGGEFTVTPVIVSAPFTNAERVDKGFVDQFVKVVGKPVTHQYQPDGVFDTQVAPGTYLLKQIDGNGGQPEFALVAVKAGFKETVVFLGHGITPADEPKAAETVIVITEATYGASRNEVLEPAYTETIHHDAVTHTEQHEVTPAVPAHYEHVTDSVVDVPEHIETVPCGHYIETVPAVPAVPAHEHKLGDYEKHGNHFDYVGAGNGEYVQHTFIFTHYDYVGHEDIAAVPAIPAIPGHYQHENDGTITVPTTYKDVPCTDFVPEVPATYETVTVTDTEAYDETVNHEATYHQVGYFVDVKAQVQADVDAGVQNIVFNNAANPGGIFDTEGHLLNQLADPLYGTLKTATIKYTVDGGAEKTVSGQEHQTISIV